MKYYDAIINIINKVKRDKIFVYASHTSFYILISAIPFITLSFLTINFFLSIDEKNIINIIIPFFPDVVQSDAKKIIQETIQNISTRILSFSLFSVLWSSSRGISAIRRGLRQIYSLKEISFIKDLLYSILYLFFIMIIVFVFLLISILPSLYFPRFFVYFIGFISFILLFTTIYYMFTERNFSFKYHLPGSIAASLFWILFIRVFSFYIKYFSNYSYIYGSITTILILALWIYFSTIIFLLGAELNSIIYTRSLNKKKTKKELL